MSSLEFPRESVERAREIASIYKKREKSKIGLADCLYREDFLEIDYGFSEALRKGNCGPYLHEIVKEAECFAGAAVFYLIARELGLNPKFYWAVNMKQMKEGQTENDAGLMDHSFIGIPIDNYEQIIDKFMTTYGKVKFSKETNSMEVYNSTDRITTRRVYETLIEMPQYDIIKQLEELRKNGGGRLSLSGSGKVISYGYKTFVTFNKNNNFLSTKINFTSDLPKDEPYQKSEIYKLETKVNEDGRFDFSDGNFLFYYAGAWGWSHHVDEQEPLIIPTKEAEIAWNLIGEIFKYNKGRKNVHKSGFLRMKVNSNKLGLNYDFSAKPFSIAEKIINEEFGDKIDSLKNSIEMSVEDFFDRAKKHEITWRTFLREAQYFKALYNKISPENELGYVYSKDEHEEFLLESFKYYGAKTKELCDNHMKFLRMKAGLIKGSNRLADSKINSNGNKFSEDISFIDSLISYRKIKNQPYVYPMVVDRVLFFKQFDVAKDPISKLEEGLSEEDFFNEGKNRLFNALLVGASIKKGLLAKKYHPGLRKILRKF